MIVEIKVPSVGESVTEAVLTQWFRQDGDAVRKGEPLFVIETDKVTLEVESEADGVLSIKVAEGETIAIGAVVGHIDTAGAPLEAEAPKIPPIKEAPAIPPRPDELEPAVSAAVEPKVMEPAAPPKAIPVTGIDVADKRNLSPSVRRLMAEKSLDLSQISGTGPGGRITKGDVILYLEQAGSVTQKLPTMPAALEAMGPQTVEAVEEKITRKPMSPIRQRIAARLLEAKQNTAMLTTFNEIDMSRVINIRAQYKEAFQKKHGISLGFMSFFIKASVTALQEFPEINAFIEDKEIVYHHYQHIGVAVGSERGLVVPVIRHAERLGFAQLEQAIVDFVAKINENRLNLADLEGGTFTISNGGVYGSMLSTPILNMPQSAILGMHKIEKRPVVADDQVVIRPMMYVALSYDHRIVDGREAVTFLKRIKEFVENPERMMMEM